MVDLAIASITLVVLNLVLSCTKRSIGSEISLVLHHTLNGDIAVTLTSECCNGNCFRNLSLVVFGIVSFVTSFSSRI